MASSPKFACLFFFFFLFTTLLFALQIHARDSQFFNKQTPKTNPQQLPSKKNEVEEEEPAFLPQTSGTGYGLYGHETGLNPPTTAADDNDDNNEAISHHDQKNYATELKGLSASGFLDDVPRKSNNYYNNNNGEKNYDYNYNYYAGVGDNGGVDNQGISDTRVLGNGKHSYEMDAGNRLDQYDHHYQSNYKSYPNNYNDNYYLKDEYSGHFVHGNNNHGEYYNNKYYNNGNAMRQGYQNQMHGEEEFEFHP